MVYPGVARGAVWHTSAHWATESDSITITEQFGRYAVDAINRFDYNAIMGTTLIIAFIYVLVNLVVDVLYVIIDPRISYA